MSVIGAIRVIMGLETANYESGLNRVRAKSAQTGTAIERSFSRMRSSVVSDLRKMAAALGATVLASALVSAARGAIDFASGLGETAQQIGVTVEQLQIMRLAAEQNGASVEGMERAVAILNRTLGQAKAGLPAAVQAFRNVGISKEQLENLHNAGEAFPLVAEGISRFSTEAEQAAAAQRLFGRGAAELLPLLEQGRAGWDAATQAAVRNGLVTEEQARKADEAADGFAALGAALRVDLVNAVSDALPGLLELGRILAGLLSMIIRFLGFLGQVAHFLIAPARTSFIGGIAGAVGDIIGQRLPGIQGATAGAAAGGALGATRGFSLDMSPAPHGGGGGRNRSDQAARHQHQYEQELTRLQVEELQARRDNVDDLDERSRIDDQIAGLEREQAEADIRFRQRQGEIDATEAANLLEKQRNLDTTRAIGRVLDHTREGQEREAQIAEQQTQAHLDILRSNADLARTAQERRRIELEILDLTYQRRRQVLEETIRQRPGSREAAEAAAALPGLDGHYQAERAGVLNSTMGPLESFLSGIPRTAAQVNEALQSIAADGLRNLTSGLAQSLAGVRSLDDAFKALKNVALNALSSILEMMLQRGLANMLGSIMGKGGGGGGFDFGSFLKTTLDFSSAAAGKPGFASGGSFSFGGMAGIDRNLLSLNGQPIARVSKGERGMILPQGANSNRREGGDTYNLHLTVPYTGNLATKDDAIAIGRAIAPVALAAIREARRRSG